MAAVEFEPAFVLHRAGVQVAYTPEQSTVVYKAGVMVAFRADESPVDGGYQPIGYMNNAENPDMVLTDVIFPECISYGSTGSPNYLTDKNEVFSGAESRNTRHEYPRHEYTIVMENLPADEISEIMNIWHVCEGDYAAFLFLDPMDHTSKNTSASVSGTTVSATDQVVATAVGAQTDYELYKYYVHGANSKRRRIRYPQVDTLVVAVNGYAITSWEWREASQVLRFLKPVSSQTQSVNKVGAVIDGDWSDFTAGDLVYVTGFSAGGNNFPEGGNPLRVVAASGSGIQLQKFDGTTWGTAGDQASVSVTIKSALPPTGSQITAGYYFHVPVRFDDGNNALSEIVAGMRESAIATFAEIKLREVFE